MSLRADGFKMLNSLDRKILDSLRVESHSNGIQNHLDSLRKLFEPHKAAFDFAMGEGLDHAVRDLAPEELLNGDGKRVRVRTGEGSVFVFFANSSAQTVVHWFPCFQITLQAALSPTPQVAVVSHVVFR